jgi:hypothetical protein
MFTLYIIGYDLIKITQKYKKEKREESLQMALSYY